MKNKNIVKCPTCENEKYSLVNEGTVSGERLELRQCNKCFRRYKVKIVAGVEILVDINSREKRF